MSASSAPEPDASPDPAPPHRLISTLGLVFAVVLLLVIGAAAWIGYQSGLSARAEQVRATQIADLRDQFARGTTDLAEGRSAMAVARFEYILKADPNYPDAKAKLAQAQAALHVTPTPVPPTPAASPNADESPAAILAQAEASQAAQDWDGVISQITRLRAIAPNYQAASADQLLYNGLRQRGLARILGDQMEAGIFDLDQAGLVRPLDAEARNYRAWARLYLAAKSFWIVDWPKSADILEQLYVLAPNFKDTSHLLHEAALNAASVSAAAGQACAALAYYETAQHLAADAQLAEKQATAQANCQATPSATATEPGHAVTATPTAKP